MGARLASWFALALSGWLALYPSAALGQASPEEADGLHDLRGYPFQIPPASPLEPVTRLAIVHVARDTVSRWTGQPQIGDWFGFWIHRSENREFELAGALAGNVFSRFDLESSSQTFLEVHYVVGLQLKGLYKKVAWRAELFHISSHLGDEIIEQTGLEPIDTSREGITLLGQIAPARGLMLYGGPGFLISSADDFEPVYGRLGGAWRGRRIGGGPFRPYLGGEVYTWGEDDWTPRLTTEAGVQFASDHLRLAVIFGAGPSRAEQFFREDEVMIGLIFEGEH